MGKSFSFRARPSLISAIDARAAQLAKCRSAYILWLVERDLSKADVRKPRGHKFVPRDLIGAFRTGIRSGTNENVRRIIRQRLKERWDKKTSAEADED